MEEKYQCWNQMIQMKMLSNTSLVISIGRACQSHFAICSSRACTVSVVKPDLRSLFCPKLILKQGFLSHPEGYIFTLIKTMPLMDKDINVRGWVGGFWMQKWEVGTAPTVCVKLHVKSEFNLHERFN